jgi:uncharacterized protein
MGSNDAHPLLERRNAGPPTPALRRTAMIHRWDQLAFVHWPYDPAAVQALLPPGLTPDTFDGWAWVALVPFYVTISTPKLPAIPWLSRFAEINVRTYVRGPDGRTGVWFLSLDAARLGPVCVARATHGLAYRWAQMSFRKTGRVMTYWSRRRWPGRSPVACHLGIEIDGSSNHLEPSPLEHFLITRWRFYCRRHGDLASALVDHVPWPLQGGRLLFCHDELIEECGLPRPQGTPVVHFSQTLDVRMEWPEIVAADTQQNAVRMSLQKS